MTTTAASARPLIAAGLAVAAAAVALAASHAPGFSPPPAVVTADTALVLSGDVDYVRAARAAELYRAGAVRSVLVTGRGIGGDSAYELRAVCLRRGVPAESILIEPDSTSTRENMLFVAAVVRGRGFHRVALVTSASHMGRAERAARMVMPDVEWLAVPVPDAGPPARVYRVRLEEWLKLAHYALRGWV